MKKSMGKKGAPKMSMGGKVHKPAPITAPGGTNLNGKKIANRLS